MPAPHHHPRPAPSDPSGPSRRLSRRGLLGAAAAATASAAAVPPAVAAPHTPPPGAPRTPPRGRPLFAGNSKLSRPDRVFLERGLMHGAWVRSGSQDEWVPDAELWRGSGFNAPTFYNPPLYSQEVMDNAGSPVWSLAKGPRGNHLEPPPPASEALLPPEVLPHVDHLFTACFGDEEPFSEDRLEWLIEYYRRMHRDHPYVLVHNNQAIGQYPDPEMRRYVAEASPDLLSFDYYYFHRAEQFEGGSVGPLYRHTGRYRRLALEGQDRAATRSPSASTRPGSSCTRRSPRTARPGISGATCMSRSRSRWWSPTRPGPWAGSGWTCSAGSAARMRSRTRPTASS